MFEIDGRAEPLPGAAHDERVKRQSSTAPIFRFENLLALEHSRARRRSMASSLPSGHCSGVAESKPATFALCRTAFHQSEPVSGHGRFKGQAIVLFLRARGSHRTVRSTDPRPRTRAYCNVKTLVNRGRILPFERHLDRGTFSQGQTEETCRSRISPTGRIARNLRSAVGPCHHRDDGRFRRFRPQIAQGSRFCTRVAESEAVAFALESPNR